MHYPYHHAVLNINTSHLYHFLCTILYSTNHNLPCIDFTFLIKQLELKMGEKNHTHSKLWLVKHRVVNKKCYREFVFVKYCSQCSETNYSLVQLGLRKWLSNSEAIFLLSVVVNPNFSIPVGIYVPLETSSKIFCWEPCSCRAI